MLTVGPPNGEEEGGAGEEEEKEEEEEGEEEVLSRFQSAICIARCYEVRRQHGCGGRQPYGLTADLGCMGARSCTRSCSHLQFVWPPPFQGG